jgi:hypothetical protein|nr:MAG TPA: hypothetical protein [Caudoviricetes sp.]
MNILYVDMTSMNVEEVALLHEQLSYKLNGDLITLPMNTRLLYDVRLEDLYDLKAKVDAAIKEKENGTNT